MGENYQENIPSLKIMVGQTGKGPLRDKKRLHTVVHHHEIPEN